MTQNIYKNPKETKKRPKPNAIQHTIDDTRERRLRINLTPHYQRDYVLSHDTKTLNNYILSIIKNTAMSVITVNEHLGTGIWDVIDGKQRLTTVFSFIDGKLPGGKEFKAELNKEDVDDELLEIYQQSFPKCRKSKFSFTYENLAKEEHSNLFYKELKNRIDSYELYFHVYSSLSPNQEREIFSVLNMGSKSLNEMEVNRAFYYGNLIKWIDETIQSIAENPVTKQLLENKNFKSTEKNNRRKIDSYVLRFHTINNIPNKDPFYQDEFIHPFSVSAQRNILKEHKDKKPINTNSFVETIEFLLNYIYCDNNSHQIYGDFFFPENIFTIRGGKNKLNNRVFDVLMYFFYKYIKENKLEKVKKNIDKFKEAIYNILTNENSLINFGTKGNAAKQEYYRNGFQIFERKFSEIVRFEHIRRRTYIMIDESTNMYKFGHSIDVAIREKTLLSQAPKIKCLYYVEGHIEPQLKKEYIHKRGRGEWFDLTDSELDEIVKTYEFIPYF